MTDHTQLSLDDYIAELPTSLGLNDFLPAYGETQKRLIKEKK